MLLVLLQINFFKDHTKVILCPLMGSVTYNDEKRKHRTFRFDLIQQHGCSEELATRLQYAFEKVETMINPSRIQNGGSIGGVQTAGSTRSATNKQYVQT